MKLINYLGLLVAFLFGVGVVGMFIQPEIPEPVQQMDYSDRFDRLEEGIKNSAIDVCFQWGGQWLIDGNSLITRDFEIPLEDGLLAKGQAIMCVKQ